MDALGLRLRFSPLQVVTRTNLHSTWSHLLANTDHEAARRLELDPGNRADPRKLTIHLNRDATQGFSVTVDQLLTSRVFWVPDLDVFVSAGEPATSWTAHASELEARRDRRVLDTVQREPEASYAQFANRWEDMGSPRYRNPEAPAPGHIVCVSWEGALHKFGIDRGAGVRNDLGNPDRFRLGFDFGQLNPELASSWKDQELRDGLPVLTTIIERAGIRYEVEQFAYPLHGPPDGRRGDIPMVLLQQVRLRNLEDKPRPATVKLTLDRELPEADGAWTVRVEEQAQLLETAVTRRALLVLEGTNLTLQADPVPQAKPKRSVLSVGLELPASGSTSFVLKLPSPTLPPAEHATLRALNFDACRDRTVAFWSGWLARGATFEVPETAVNNLFRANLWHALRLPRRHAAASGPVTVDLPYSNFAYGQEGTPWPVNQAVYVDYMLYDLRGYHELAAEELAVMFRCNQEPNGHVKGYANWGVYTPSMLYAVAKHHLLAGDHSALQNLLPPSLRALDWCLAEMRTAAERANPAPGLILAPLNDLSHDQRAWAFNQAYFFAGCDLFGRVLAETGHPRAPACQAAARSLFTAIERGYSRAAVQSPLVQLADHTWIPYVPGDALNPRRLMEVWYPTDVDTGPLHLPRLKALAPGGKLTTWLLHDHEDNLFYRNWGMANEPVYNQQAMAYLFRDEVKPAIRAFYSMMACAFSHSVFEPVEHRWGWGQYFGPPSTDGAWFELYRHMLIHERDDNSLLLLQAAPRPWLEDGKRIRIERAPTEHGPLNLTLDSRTGAGEIAVQVDAAWRRPPAALLVRLRHPQERRLRSVTVNDRNWEDFDAGKEWVRIVSPQVRRYVIVARY